MKTKLYLFLAIILLCASSAAAQVNLPRESQRQMIMQTVGDTTVAVVYHRPNTKDRKIWGELVPYNEVWRTGANEATTFEISNDVRINGQVLPKGKYSLHTIPNKDEWTVIFNKTADQWGSFDYDMKQDALRIKVKPLSEEMRETMTIGFENVKPNAADMFIAWEKIKVPFTVDVGDVNGRVLADLRTAMSNLKPDDGRTPAQAANWVLSMKSAANYKEALDWVEIGLKKKENFGLLTTKARLLMELNRKAEAIAVAEKAVKVGKAATPAVDTGGLEKMIADWKSQK